MNVRVLATINLIVTIIVIAWNGYTGANGWNGNTVGGMSDVYNSLFTPAGYAFSIWSLIFIGLMVLAIQFMRIAFSQKDDPKIVATLAPPLIAANLLNSVWVFVWLNEMPAVSVIIMLGILVSLLVTNVQNTQLANYSTAHKAMVTWPLQTYVGWIIVATVANVSSYLNYVGFDFVFSEVVWACIMIVIASVIIGYVFVTKKWVLAVFVGIWALIAIEVKQYGVNPPIAYTAMACTFLLAVLYFVRLKK